MIRDVRILKQPSYICTVTGIVGKKWYLQNFLFTFQSSMKLVLEVNQIWKKVNKSHICSPVQYRELPFRNTLQMWVESEPGTHLEYCTLYSAEKKTLQLPALISSLWEGKTFQNLSSVDFDVAVTGPDLTSSKWCNSLFLAVVSPVGKS